MITFALFAILFLWVLLLTVNNGSRSAEIKRLKTDIKDLEKDVNVLTDEIKKQLEQIDQLENDLIVLNQ